MLTKIKKIVRADSSRFFLLFIAITFSIVIALSSVLKLFFSINLDKIHSYEPLAYSLFLQLVIIIFSAEAWLYSLNNNKGSLYRYELKTFMISGLFNACKYIPGKIWGILIRGTLIKMHTSGEVKVKNTLVDQLAMLHAGLFVLLLTVCLEVNFLMFMVMSILFLLSIKSINPLLRFLKFFLFKSKLRILMLIGRHCPDECEGYFGVVFRFIIIWLLLAASLGFCIYVINENLAFDFSMVVKVTVVSYFAGFIVFFMPGGIGVRDGVLYLLLQGSANSSDMLLVALLHRIVVTIADILLALPALFFLREVLTFDK